MQLTRKLTLALGMAVSLVLLVAGIAQVRRELRLFQRDTARDHHALITALSAAAAEVRHLGGDREAKDVIEHANSNGVPVEVRWLEKPASAKLPDAATRALRSGKEVRATDPRTGAFLLYKAVADGPSRVLLELFEPADEMRSYTRTTVLSVAITTLVIAIVLVVLAHLLGARIVGRPVGWLTEKARRVGRGELGPPLVVRQSDELGLLANEMNAMCDNLAASREVAERETSARIEALEQLRHADRLATAGKLAAGIAHELGTPLNVVSGRARLIEMGEMDDDEVHDSARVIAEQAQRMTDIIRQLLDFARVDRPKLERGDLRSVAHEACVLLRPSAEKKGITLVFDAPPDKVEATFSWSQLLQAVMNLVVNALQASSTGGNVTLATRVVEVLPPREHGGPSGQWAVLSVHDDGPGMEPEVSARVFEPFFTTKAVGEGTGLGLSVAYGIARDNGGWIEVETRPRDGSTFSLYLPATCRRSMNPKAA